LSSTTATIVDWWDRIAGTIRSFTSLIASSKQIHWRDCIVNWDDRIVGCCYLKASLAPCLPSSLSLPPSTFFFPPSSLLSCSLVHPLPKWLSIHPCTLQAPYSSYLCFRPDIPVWTLSKIACILLNTSTLFVPSIPDSLDFYLALVELVTGLFLGRRPEPSTFSSGSRAYCPIEGLFSANHALDILQPCNDLRRISHSRPSVPWGS
jgi:hypothetical protein